MAHDLTQAQLARDVGGVNVGGVKGMFVGIKWMSCTTLFITCVFMLSNIVFHITFVAPSSTLCPHHF